MVEGSRGYLGRECRGDMLDRDVDGIECLEDWRKMEKERGDFFFHQRFLEFF